MSAKFAQRVIKLNKEIMVISKEYTEEKVLNKTTEQTGKNIISTQDNLLRHHENIPI